ncbi:MAG: dienelactone hydrolase family protein [Acidimicrobiales bacterium]
MSTPATTHWHPHDVTSKGVRERRFDIDRTGRIVPGMLWTPEHGDGPRPLVLIGHGAAQTKNETYVVTLARTLVRHHGIAAAAIDGPVHGDRRNDGVADPTTMFLEFGQAWGADPAVTDDMVGDWRATLDSLGQLPEIGRGPVGYWGLSMGTILGLPLVAAEDRISVAVLGLMGTSGPTRDRIVADAATLTCPVLFLVQWDDELFERDKAFALFDRLGTADKRLHANPGAHSAVPPEEFQATVHFLASHLQG